MPSPYHEEHDAYLENYLRTGERKIIGIGREVSAVRRDGTVFPAELSVDEFLDGEQRLFTGVLRDITRRKRSEAEVNRRREDHARMIRLAIMGEMATALAHELNQPLHAISAYAHAGIRLMQAGNNTPEKLVYALEQAAGQAQRAGDIIRRIRSYVRRTEGSKVPLQINALVRQVAGFLAAELRDQRISIELELDEALPGVPGDELQIEQVLLNLMRNAMEAMLSAHRRVLTLSTAPESGGGVRVSVRDSGPGIEPEALARIFEPFYTSKVDGTGMGLAISRTLVESWEGSLWAESEPGRGACFHFTVPGDGTPPAHDDAAASA